MDISGLSSSAILLIAIVVVAFLLLSFGKQLFGVIAAALQASGMIEAQRVKNEEETANASLLWQGPGENAAKVTFGVNFHGPKTAPIGANVIGTLFKPTDPLPPPRYVFTQPEPPAPQPPQQ